MLKRSTAAEFKAWGKVSFRVRYADTDAMSVVYHSNYFWYFESGRAELIRHLWKPYAQIEKEGLIFPIIEASCRYYGAAHYDDLITVHTKVGSFSGARLRFDYQIHKEGENYPLVRGFTEHCFTNTAGKPRRMPEEFSEILGSFQKKPFERFIL